MTIAEMSRAEKSTGGCGYATSVVLYFINFSFYSDENNFLYEWLFSGVTRAGNEKFDSLKCP